MNLAERTQATFKLEQRRAISNGILETAGTTFLLAWAALDYGPEFRCIGKAPIISSGTF